MAAGGAEDPAGAGEPRAPLDAAAPAPREGAAPTRLEAAAQAWLQAQRAAFQIVRDTEGVPRTPTDTAEGYRWVTRLASLAQEWFVEKADPLHPQLFTSQDEYRKLLVDNPDVHYRFAALDDQCAYRLTGTRGDAPYVGLTFGTPFGQGTVDGRTGTLTQVNLDQFALGPNGEVDILIAPAGAVPDPRPANVIELVPGTGQLAVRETLFDPRHDRHAELRLALVDPVRPPVLGAEELAGALELAGLFVQFVAATAVQMWRDTAEHVNTFGGTAGAHHVDSQEDEVRSHSDADMTYHGGRWLLGDDEALVVTVHRPPRPFVYWGLTITSAWMESYDYRYTTTNLNNKTALPHATDGTGGENGTDSTDSTDSQNDADGTIGTADENGDWRLVIAPRDPGVANWLDTGGRREGYMIVRWVLADGPPHPTCELVPIGSLAGT